MANYYRAKREAHRWSRRKRSQSRLRIDPQAPLCIPLAQLTTYGSRLAAKHAELLCSVSVHI